MQPYLRNGDTITPAFAVFARPQQLYPKIIQDYLFSRYPEYNLRFFNAGWGGETSAGLFGRLERDVLSLNPTVVTLYYGMNDGGYKTVNDATLNTFRNNMEGVIKKLLDRQIRVIVFTPGCADEGKLPVPLGYNEALSAMGQVAHELAQKYNCPFADIHAPMLAFMKARKLPGSSYRIFPEDGGVHPNEAGHFVIAAEMLKGIGAEPSPGFNLDAAKAVRASDGTLTLATHMPINVPFWIMPEMEEVARDSGLLTLAGQDLTISNLLPGIYVVSINGERAGQFSAKQLSESVELIGNYSERARQIYDLTTLKDANFFNTWRHYRLGGALTPIDKPLSDPVTVRAVDSLMKVDDNYSDALHTLSTPSPEAVITLQKTDLPADAGPNLAFRKSYVSSDPNRRGNGEGLTDGSWQISRKTAFNTGMSPDFPKTVTIDLGKVFDRISLVKTGSVKTGVTKTVKVSLSSDNKTFTEVGSHAFAQGKDEKYIYTFPPQNARYVRLTYLDHYDGPELFCGSPEAEVYTQSQEQ